MIMRTLDGLIAAVALVLTSQMGCPQPVTPLPDGSDAAPMPAPAAADSSTGATCALACNALGAAGCALGDAGDCVTFMLRDIGSGKVPNVATGTPLTCLAVSAVRTKTDAQKLGFVCP
jgi:hypothetical protein